MYYIKGFWLVHSSLNHDGPVGSGGCIFSPKLGEMIHFDDIFHRGAGRKHAG